MTAGPLLNISKDGDASRRNIFSDMMTNDISNYEFGKYLEDLLLLDLYVGVKGLSVNYDAKYLAKRLRTTLISEKQCIGQRAISHVDLNEMVQLCKGFNNVSSVPFKSTGQTECSMRH